MLNFYKYQGAGNDFIMINNLEQNTTLDSNKIKNLCDRNFGIGADGIILLDKSEKADCFMNYYNSDGTIAEMCGNGIRCTAKFFINQTNSTLKELNIETRAGVKKIKINEDDTYSVNMGLPVFSHTDFPMEPKEIEGFNFEFVSMGNPHAVTKVNDLNEIKIKEIGPKIEKNIIFPNKINVEFIEKINNNHYRVMVWERGCGVTLACGTGACAVFSIINKNKDLDEEIVLDFPGGKLFLSKNEDGCIILRGPASFVFEGKI